MKKSLKRILACVMVVVMSLTAIPFGIVDFLGLSQTALAANGVADRLNSLRSKFPDGYYWNHKVTAYSNNADELVRRGDESFANSVTSSPCKTHNSVANVGEYDCNYFDGGVQCYGFAGKVFYDVFGQRKSALQRIYGNNGGVQVGDYIRVNGDKHSAVVLSRNGNTVTVVECNLDLSGPAYNCKIRWGASYNISSITYYCHATNYDAVNNSTGSVSPYFTSVTASEITDNSAKIASTINLAYVSSAGFYLGTSKDSMSKAYTETVNANTLNIWYNIKDECSITLKHATTYYYKFFIVVNSTEYQSEIKSFTTTGSHNYVGKVTKQPTCTKTGVKTYTCSCGNSYTESIALKSHFDSDKDGKCDSCGRAFTIGRPSKVTASQTTDSITLKWDKVANANMYRIYWKNNKGAWQSVGDVASTGCIFEKLSVGAKYTFAVRAGVKVDGKIQLSKTYTEIGTATKAEKPSKVASDQNSNAIKLTWAKSNGADGYRIYYRRSTKASWEVAVSSTKSLTHTFSNLKPNRAYQFAVRPYIITDSGVVWSSYVTIIASTTPETPAVKVTSPSKGKITLSWNEVSGATVYKVYYKVGNGSWKLYKTVAKPTTYNFANLKSGTKYTFAVRAYRTVSGINFTSGYKAVSVTVK